MLLYGPDKNALEWKALAAACDAQKTNPVELLAACGAIPSTHEYHFGRFLAEAFPQGVAFADWGALPAMPAAAISGVGLAARAWACVACFSRSGIATTDASAVSVWLQSG